MSRPFNILKLTSISSILFVLSITERTVSKETCQTRKVIYLEEDGEGRFTSEGYPDEYDTHSRCQWEIIAPPDYLIQFTLFVHSLEVCPLCDCDHVEIYDGQYSSENLTLIRACKVFNGTFTTTSNTSLINFHTADKGAGNLRHDQHKGFYLEFVAVRRYYLANDPKLGDRKVKITGSYVTEYFFVDGKVWEWSDDLRDLNNDVYRLTKEQFTTAFRLLYRQAGIAVDWIEVLLFRKENDKTIADYCAVLTVLNIENDVGIIKDRIGNATEKAVGILYSSGMYDGLFVNVPVHRMNELVFAVPGNSRQAVEIAVGCVAALTCLAMAALAIFFLRYPVLLQRVDRLLFHRNDSDQHNIVNDNQNAQTKGDPCND